MSPPARSRALPCDQGVDVRSPLEDDRLLGRLDVQRRDGDAVILHVPANDLDRLLVAQAMLAQLVIATSDAEISRDGVPVAW